jgi:hypothetical protein
VFGVSLPQERAAALEVELRKSKRAEQKLQALLYRLRQDVAEVKQGADLLAKLEDQRGLEYEVDFLTNKVKVSTAYSAACQLSICADLEPGPADLYGLNQGSKL